MQSWHSDVLVNSLNLQPLVSEFLAAIPEGGPHEGLPRLGGDQHRHLLLADIFNGVSEYPLGPRIPQQDVSGETFERNLGILPQHLLV